MSAKKRHRHVHYRMGGWVAPLCPAQFPGGSVQGDVSAPADGPVDGSTGASGDAGGTAP